MLLFLGRGGSNLTILMHKPCSNLVRGRKKPDHILTGESWRMAGFTVQKCKLVKSQHAHLQILSKFRPKRSIFLNMQNAFACNKKKTRIRYSTFGNHIHLTIFEFSMEILRVT